MGMKHALPAHHEDAIFWAITQPTCIWSQYLGHTSKSKLSNQNTTNTRQVSESHCPKIKHLRVHHILKVKDQIVLEQVKLGYKACKNLLPTKFANNILTDSTNASFLKSHNYNT